MTREEIKQALQASGTLNVKKSQDPNWKKAFDLYNKTFKQNMNINCGGCWTRVMEWVAR